MHGEHIEYQAVILNPLSQDVFSIIYPSQHLACPSGCGIRMWSLYATVMIMPASREWHAYPICHACQKSYKWVVLADLPLNEHTVVLSPWPEECSEGQHE
jgi:hypothetical protein